MSEGAKKTVADHIRQILARLLKVEQRLESLDSRVPAEGTADLGPPLDREVVAHVLELETRLTQIEDENRDLAGLCSRLNEQNEAISNLYVAKHRLHASFDAGEIMKIVTEILNELVGAQAFSIMFVEQKKKVLRRVAGRGARDAAEAVPLGEGLLGEIAVKGAPFYYEGPNGGERPGEIPLAVIPLKTKEACVGVIVIYELLPHKSGLTPVDHQLLELVAEHAPSALRSARLHRLSKSQHATPSR